MPRLVIPRLLHRRLERGALQRPMRGLPVLLRSLYLLRELPVAFAQAVGLLEPEFEVKLLLGDLPLLPLLKRPVVVVEVVEVVLRLHLPALRRGEPFLVLRLGGDGGGFLSLPLFSLLAAVRGSLRVRRPSRRLLRQPAQPLLLPRLVQERHRVGVDGRFGESLEGRLRRLANLLHARQPEQPEGLGQPSQLQFFEPEDEAAVVLFVPAEVGDERADALLHRLAVLLGPRAEFSTQLCAALFSLGGVGVGLVGFFLLFRLLLLFILIVLVFILLACSGHFLPERLQTSLLLVHRGVGFLRLRRVVELLVAAVNLLEVYVPHPQKLHVRRLVSGQKQQRAALPSHPRGPPDPVHERGGILRRVELHHPVHARDVQTSRRDVGAQ
mmetsp:Transcript_11989/g.55596  ORF Transcript_11989/g.55596 Transcript_11989/m.55596 type:complete len:383 (-) Transcript_11989:842-1990(-)